MDLLNLLPAYYKSSPEVVELQGAYQNQAETVAAVKADCFRQLDVNTATWGLLFWEQAYGLKTDITKSFDYRRTRVKSKIRGAGTTTKKMIQNVSESFSNGEVDVIEHSDEYRFEIKFIGTLGIPPNMDDLTAAIEEIKPAHLAYAYIFTYITWNDFDNYNKDWNEWDGLNLTWDDFETYKEVV